MKILFISALLPYPLISGGQVRIYNLLKAAAKGHEITLFSYIRDKSEIKYLEKLNFLKKIELFERGKAIQFKYVLPALAGKNPLLIESYNNQQIRKRIDEALKNNKFDLIHIEPYYVIPSLPNKLHLPLVICEHNIEYEIYLDHADTYANSFVKWVLKKDSQKVKQSEQLSWTRANHIIAVSQSDADIIASLVNRNKISIVPNGVDLDRFCYKKHKLNPASPNFLFVGNFSWVPNIESIHNIIYELWPKIKLKYPAAKLRIIGKNLPQKIQSSLQTDRIEYFSNVENIESEYQQADILIAPMKIGGGSKFKILEAMASGLNVITTPAGVHGLKAHDLREFLMAESTDDMLKLIDTIINNPKLAKEISDNARAMIENHYSWKAIAVGLSKAWKKTYEEYQN